jgi:hypothetical protein
VTDRSGTQCDADNAPFDTIEGEHAWLALKQGDFKKVSDSEEITFEDLGCNDSCTSFHSSLEQAATKKDAIDFSVVSRPGCS